MNLVIFLVRRRYVSHRNEQVCHDYIAPQLGDGMRWRQAPVFRTIRSPHKTRLPPCGRLNVR